MSGRSSADGIGRRLSGEVLAFEWFWLMMILPVALFPTATRVPILLALPGLWVVRKVATGHFVPATPVDGALLVFLLMVLVTVLISPDLTFNLSKVTGVVYGVAVYYAVAAAGGRSREYFFRALLLFMGLAVVIVGLSLVGTRWPSVKLPLVPSIQARLPERVYLLGEKEGFSANQVAGTLLWVAPASLTAVLAAGLDGRGFVPWQGKRTRMLVGLFMAGAAVAVCGMLILTQSRGGLIGFLSALVLMVPALLWRRQRRAATIYVFLAVVLVAGLGLVGGERVSSWLEGQLPPRSSVESVSEAAGSRQDIWARGVYGLGEVPWTGLGLGNFRRAIVQFYPLFDRRAGQDIAHAHNYFLQTGLDLGIPGLAAHLATWLGMGAMLLQSWRTAEQRWERLLSVGFAGSLVAYSVYGLTDAVALGARPGFMLWMLFGLIAALNRHKDWLAPGA